MKNIIQKTTCLAALGSAVLLTTGCKTVVRENIIASVETGLGVTVAENPKTEMYEAKVGFIRSQFYSIPTGKVVENEDIDSDERKTTKTVTTDRSGKKTIVTKIPPSDIPSAKADKRSNHADVTPEVVSGIRVNTGIQHLFLGADISENFAVGKDAVKSRAAIAMYIADAKDPKSAQAASDAVGSTKGIDSFIRRSEMENSIVTSLNKLTPTQQKDFYGWVDKAFPVESKGQLAAKNDANYFKGVFLPAIADEQTKIVLNKLNE